MLVKLSCVFNFLAAISCEVSLRPHLNLLALARRPRQQQQHLVQTPWAWVRDSAFGWCEVQVLATWEILKGPTSGLDPERSARFPFGLDPDSLIILQARRCTPTRFPFGLDPDSLSLWAWPRAQRSLSLWAWLYFLQSKWSQREIPFSFSWVDLPNQAWKHFI